ESDSRVRAHTSPVYLQVEGRPLRLNADTIAPLFAVLDAMLAWAQRDARCGNEHQREQLMEIFQAARQELLRRYSERREAGSSGRNSVPRRYMVLILIPTVLMIAGTVGYYLLEESYSLFDAFYMTVITLTTVGYEEVHELSPPGRAFTIVLLLVGVL